MLKPLKNSCFYLLTASQPSTKQFSALLSNTKINKKSSYPKAVSAVKNRTKSSFFKGWWFFARCSCETELVSSCSFAHCAPMRKIHPRSSSEIIFALQTRCSSWDARAQHAQIMQERAFYAETSKGGDLRSTHPPPSFGPKQGTIETFPACKQQPLYLLYSNAGTTTV